LGRDTKPPLTRPLALTAEFAGAASKQTQRAAFVRRMTTTLTPASLQQTVESVAQLVMPAAKHEAIGKRWQLGCPWT